MAIGFPGEKKISSRFAGFDTQSITLYYRQFSISGWQFICLHQTYTEAKHLKGFQRTNQEMAPALEATIENIAYPFAGQSNSRLRYKHNLSKLSGHVWV
jgi:hypothetical protein